ncbi:hypothetical protein EVAR_49914_1 [Eumeta japonica]|uniref:Uncharacterized protein n=1 Tax=Eumeta variegata TaxID=151549 RepID=A0A4C1Y4A6_EUMVA|nr:hypothetical protein EVAR_49914_1 [Eumeta japonica]
MGNEELSPKKLLGHRCEQPRADVNADKVCRTPKSATTYINYLENTVEANNNREHTRLECIPIDNQSDETVLPPLPSYPFVRRITSRPD